MAKQSRAHENFEWAKQKLDEIDAVLASLEQSATKLQGAARQEADQSLARIKAVQSAFAAKVDAARAETSAVKGIGEDAYAALAAQWADLELAFQKFLTAAAGQADLVKQALATRAAAQRDIWLAPLDAARAAASQALDQARAEINASLRRVATETEKAQARL